MRVQAPFRGVVTVRHHEPGEILSAGSPVVTLLDRDDRWVTIYVPETRIGAVRLGQPAGIVSDTFPDHRYPGEVSYIASEAEFTPKTVQTREERVKLVYAVKVRVTGDPDYQLKPGMPADVTLEGVTD
jgi:HlyD family secretion protein